MVAIVVRQAASCLLLLIWSARKNKKEEGTVAFPNRAMFAHITSPSFLRPPKLDTVWKRLLIAALHRTSASNSKALSCTPNNARISEFSVIRCSVFPVSWPGYWWRLVVGVVGPWAQQKIPFRFLPE